MHARDMTYEKHPKLEKYDPFYSPFLTQTENNYRFGDEIYSEYTENLRKLTD